MKTISEVDIVCHINALIQEVSTHAAEALLKYRHSRALEDQRAIQVLRKLKSRLIKDDEDDDDDEDADTVNTEVVEDCACLNSDYIKGDSYLDWVARTEWRCWHQRYCSKNERCHSINRLAHLPQHDQQ